jgi:hypothetical protein
MPRKKLSTPNFALCLYEDEQGDSLTRHKLYRLLPDAKAEQQGYVRLIDDSGEDYLYSARFFQLLTLPVEVEQAILETTSA